MTSSVHLCVCMYKGKGGSGDQHKCPESRIANCMHDLIKYGKVG